MRFSRIVSALTCAFVLNTQATSVKNYTQYLPAGANLALVVQKTGTTTPAIDYHSQQMALPASTQKVLTSLAALLQLGPNYRFTIKVEGAGAMFKPGNGEHRLLERKPKGWGHLNTTLGLWLLWLTNPHCLRLTARSNNRQRRSSGIAGHNLQNHIPDNEVKRLITAEPLEPDYFW